MNVAARRLTPPPVDIAFTINPELDIPALARAYREHGQVRILGLFSEGCVELYEKLIARRDWVHLINTEQGVLELQGTAKRRLGKRRWAEIEAAATERTRSTFQYRYEALRVPAAHCEERDGDPLTAFARMIRSPALSAFLEAITGLPQPCFTDGQATSYGPGDFLTAHDDAVPGKSRIAAFIYGLTPHWRVEYGGLLLFHGHNDRAVSGHVPRFNTLDLFRVPARHSVSCVTAAAPHRRLALTGWLSCPTDPESPRKRPAARIAGRLR